MFELEERYGEPQKLNFIVLTTGFLMTSQKWGTISVSQQPQQRQAHCKYAGPSTVASRKARARGPTARLSVTGS